MTPPVRINKHLVIPGDEIRLKYSASGGPGGQHANKVATRVDLSWNVEDSRALGPRQRARILRALGSRIDGSGTLRLSSDRRRSQLRNREDVLARLETLVREALKPATPRVATAPSAGARERRLRDKKRRSETKRRRSAPASED
jgi:ribosome-associated protein